MLKTNHKYNLQGVFMGHHRIYNRDYDSPEGCKKKA